MKQVLVITYDFPPSVVVGAHTVAQITRHFPQLGWRPVVLTVKERYLSEIDKDFARPFPGIIVRTGVLPHPLSLYKVLGSFLHPKEAHKFASHTSPKKNAQESDHAFRRALLSLLMIPDMETGWLIPAVLTGFRKIRLDHVDHIFSSGPCWTNHLIGLILASWTGLSWTAHFRDPWAQVAMSYRDRLAQRIHRGLERLVVAKAASVVCVTAQHTNLLRQLYADLPPGKFVTIPNGFDGSEWEEAGLTQSEVRREKADRFVITYSGSLYVNRTPAPLFRALRALTDSGEVDLEKIRVELLGWCDIAEGRSIKELARDYGVDGNINMVGPLGRHGALRRLTQSDLLLLLAEDWPLQIPAKVYEYLRAARPILAITRETAVAELLKKTGGAWVVSPDDHSGIVAATLEAYRCWRDGLEPPIADQALVASFDRRLLAESFTSLFDNAAGGHNV